jgi:formamidopyrimidine-DNA glycosylase
VPELPDLQYIVAKLAPRIVGRRIIDIKVKEPIVIRVLLADAGGFVAAMTGRSFTSLERRGPFLRFSLEDRELVIHCMLAGRLQLAGAKEKLLAGTCFSLSLDDGSRLSYADEKKMGKVYLTAPGVYASIPGFREQGMDILAPEFTFEEFERLIQGRRHQARVFLMDQTALSAIGNAYADEILFAAGIHPKTSCASLQAGERRAMYESIRKVMAWGIAEVEKANQPIEMKVRDHVRVRNRNGQPCPVCGTKIRRVGVLGYDSFYCPRCQPATRKQFIPWHEERTPNA